MCRYQSMLRMFWIFHVEVSRVSEIARQKKILSLLCLLSLLITSLKLSQRLLINRDYPFLCIPQSRSGKGRLTETHNRFLSQQTSTYSLVVSVKLALLQKKLTKSYYHIKLKEGYSIYYSQDKHIYAWFNRVSKWF